MSTGEGRVVRVAGPVVVAVGLGDARLYNLVRIGRRRLIGEVIRLQGEEAVIQVYEDTSGLETGSPVEDTGGPFRVALGPGLLGQIFDGIQRPLPLLAEKDGNPYGRPFIRRGVSPPPLDETRTWDFIPSLTEGDVVEPGDVLGEVEETRALTHHIQVPPGVRGAVTRLVSGPARITDVIAVVGDTPVTMLQYWPARSGRPSAHRLDPTAPLVTGQRVIDTLFPVARGGSATIPGGFGTGKTVQEQTLVKWADADVVIYVGCGERGNELTEVLQELPELPDPRTGASLIDRTILIANTSNMPVAAREASVYTGMTMAEYYRDQGYHVALLADSTSRWGEALREVSARLGEMPGEEGFPAYLPSRLAELYERAGIVRCLGRQERTGSVTVIGAVSPPGGDFSEPVTQYSLRLAGTFWALDTDLARRRHFPAIHWTRSYSLYRLGSWFNGTVDREWEEQRAWALDLLQQEEHLQNIVQLLGADVLAPAEQLVFFVGRMIREDFLRQSAFDEIDAFCPLDKQYRMLRVIRRVHEVATAAVRRGVDPSLIAGVPSIALVGRMRSWDQTETEQLAADLEREIVTEVGAL